MLLTAGKVKRKFRQSLFRLLFVSIFIFVALCIGELIVRVTDVDWRFIKKNLYYQGSNLPNYMPVDDPDLIFAPKPNSIFTYERPKGPYTIRINSLGFRGKEQKAEKPKGVYRILVVGGSNVFGMEVNDDETWPARLEKELNENFGGGFEVFNMGANAYMGSQMARAAQLALDRIHPDLIILAISNYGAVHFLEGADPAPLFRAKPAYWSLMASAREFDFIRWMPTNIFQFAMSHIRLFRYVVIAHAAQKQSTPEPLWTQSHLACQAESYKAMQDFLKNTKGQVQSCLFVGPYLPPNPAQHQFKRGTDTLLFNLWEENLPPEYLVFHPPPHVYAWYSKKIAKWLADNKLIPERP